VKNARGAGKIALAALAMWVWLLFFPRRVGLIFLVTFCIKTKSNKENKLFKGLY
jgi:hypothetical protein